VVVTELLDLQFTIKSSSDLHVVGVPLCGIGLDKLCSS